MPALPTVPPFLELVAGGATSAGAVTSGEQANKPPHGKAQGAQAGKKDLGIGEVTSAGAVTSADMVSKK